MDYLVYQALESNEMAAMKKLGKRVRLSRLRANISQIDLAAMINLTEARFVALEHGILHMEQVKPNLLRKLSDQLNDCLLKKWAISLELGSRQLINAVLEEEQKITT